MGLCDIVWITERRKMTASPYAPLLGHQLTEQEATELLDDFCDDCDYCSMYGRHCQTDIRIVNARLGEAGDMPLRRTRPNVWMRQLPSIVCGMLLESGVDCDRPSLHAGGHQRLCRACGQADKAGHQYDCPAI